MVCIRVQHLSSLKLQKVFNAKVEIANAQAPEQFVSAQSLMKVISLGVGPGGQVILRAQGDDATASTRDAR